MQGVRNLVLDASWNLWFTWLGLPLLYGQKGENWLCIPSPEPSVAAESPLRAKRLGLVRSAFLLIELFFHLVVLV